MSLPVHETSLAPVWGLRNHNWAVNGGMHKADGSRSIADHRWSKLAQPGAVSLRVEADASAC